MKNVLRTLARAALSAVLILILSVPLADADDLATCASQKVQFDGTVPLIYATVNGSSGSRLYLNANYSDHCSPADPASCPKTPYLVSGDAVAIGEVCGTRNYVQYIGEKHISEGWVDSAALSPIAPPPSATPPVIKIGDQVFSSPKPARYRFELTQGKGIPVCEAYQQRLNQTEFYSPPYCGRPETRLVPGFATLQRRYLTADEYKIIFYDVMDVLKNERLHYDYESHTNSDGSISLIPPPDPTHPGFAPGAWTYEPPVDIENSGKGGNVLMWTLEDRYFSRCGSSNTRDTSKVRGGVSGIVVSADSRGIDRAATYSIFGLAEYSKYTPPVYIEFAHEFGVFSYHSQNYFDTFLDWRNGDANGRNVGDRSLSSTLGVFLYANHERSEVCEYHVPGLMDLPHDSATRRHKVKRQ